MIQELAESTDDGQTADPPTITLFDRMVVTKPERLRAVADPLRRTNAS
jgi:hypothetical protein